MKIAIEDIRKLVTWLETNSKQINVDVSIDSLGAVPKLIVKAFDRYEDAVKIELYDEAKMLAKINKTEVLK